MSEFISEAVGTEGENKSFENIMNNVNGNFNYLNEKIDSEIGLVSDKINTQILFGVYTGDGTAERFIDLGFTPTAIEVYLKDGKQSDESTGTNHYGGLALNGFGCEISSRQILEVVNNGFKVFYVDPLTTSNDILSNSSGKVYYFKAYKSGAIVEVS